MEDSLLSSENVVLLYVFQNLINYSTWYINRLVTYIFIISYNNIIEPHRTFRTIGYGGAVKIIKNTVCMVIICYGGAVTNICEHAVH